MEYSLNGIYKILVVMFLLILISVGMTGMMLYKFSQSQEKDEGTKENGVLIADQYTIESTENISDAFKSGSNSGMNDRDKELLDMATAVLDEIITPNMSDYEKEKAVYDWMCKELKFDEGVLTVIPTSDADSGNPYGTLKFHNAVCVGYATTFRLFMQMLDIPCMVIHNSELYHSWDLVQLDGEWYHTDIYSDVGDGSYAHFNIPDTMVSQNWDKEFFPAANGIEYNYTYQNAQKLKSVFEIPAIIRDAIDNDIKSLGMLFDGNLSEGEAQVANVMVDRIQSMLWSLDGKSETYLNYTWNPIDGKYLYTIFISSYNDSADIDVDEEEKENIINTINESFSDWQETTYEDMSWDGATPIEDEEYEVEFDYDIAEDDVAYGM